jgi:hypothetical protein
VTLVQVVELFDALLQRDGDEQAGGDGAEVDPEVLPGMKGLVRCVNVHGARLGAVRLCGTETG